LEYYLQPDLYIIYIEPDKITDLIHNLAKSEIKPSIPPISFLPVCGNVLANCYLNRAVSISFGCPESRNIGGIGKYEVVPVIPAKIADELLKFYE
jgi:uncharacterized protein (DUF169 family)